MELKVVGGAENIFFTWVLTCSRRPQHFPRQLNTAKVMHTLPDLQHSERWAHDPNINIPIIPHYKQKQSS